MEIARLEKMERIGWIAIFFLTVMGIGGASGHIFDGFFSTGDIDDVASINIALFGQEFFDHWLEFRTYPYARMFHMIPGLLVILFMPLQFISSFREKHPKLHRINGYFLILGILFLIPSGAVFAFQHAYVGFKEQVPTVFFSVIYFICLYMALKNVYAKNFAAHREWMIRIFSLALGIYAIRVWYSLFLHFSDLSSQEFFATSFWMGISFNLIVAEIWINLSREKISIRKEI